jgi:hypothetical protein
MGTLRVTIATSKIKNMENKYFYALMENGVQVEIGIGIHQSRNGNWMNSLPGKLIC